MSKIPQEMLRSRPLAPFFVFLLLLYLSFCVRLSNPYSILIKGGLILDGTGAPAFQADVGIRGQKIAKIGDIDERKAKRVIQAQDLTVTPGFIDVHTHAERNLASVPTADNYLHQGVTTLIGGNCGSHPFPLEEFFKQIEEKGISPNIGILVGHNTIRREVMGYKMEAPSSEEMEKMKDLVEKEMNAGALGFSTGLAYLPGTYAQTEEIVELATIAARYGGLYATHMRDQGRFIREAIEEAVEIGEKNRMPVQISHLKLAEEDVWNQVELIREPVEEARQRGVRIACDQYPYTATSSGFTSSFPSWCFEGGQENFIKKLGDKETYIKIRSYIIEKRFESARGINRLEKIFIAESSAFPQFEGKNLQEILLLQGKRPTPEEAAHLIIEIEKRGGASAIFFQMDERDVEDLMRLPYVMYASDGGIVTKEQGVPHPRNYGTFPRVIGLYVREKAVLTLEEAVRKMSSLPADTFGIQGRGIIREGACADITVFDAKTFVDRSTYAEPHQFSEGLSYVLVNGEIVIDRGEHTGRLPGMVLKNYPK